MQQISVNEISRNFPKAIERFYNQREAIVVTERSKPQFVVMSWSLFQEQQVNNAIAARVQLEPVVDKMLKTIGGMVEAYQPESPDHKYDIETLQFFAHQCWDFTGAMPEPYNFLAVLISNALQDTLEREEPLSQEQLTMLEQAISLFNDDALTKDQVRVVDLALLDVGLNCLLPPEGEFAPGEIAELFERQYE